MTKLIINNPSEEIIKMVQVFTTDYKIVSDRPYRKPKCFREILEFSGLSGAAFARTYGMSNRSIQNWIAPDDAPAHRDCPQYLMDLLAKDLDMREDD